MFSFRIPQWRILVLLIRSRPAPLRYSGRLAPAISTDRRDFLFDLPQLPVMQLDHSTPETGSKREKCFEDGLNLSV